MYRVSVSRRRVFQMRVVMVTCRRARSMACLASVSLQWQREGQEMAGGMLLQREGQEMAGGMLCQPEGQEMA